MRGINFEESEATFANDVDSILIIAKSLGAFVIDEKLTIRCSDNNASYTKNIKLIQALGRTIRGYNEKEKWWELRVGGFGDRTILMLFRKTRWDGIRSMAKVRRTFLKSVIGKAVGCLDVKSHTRAQGAGNVGDMTYGTTNIYGTDWSDFVACVDELTADGEVWAEMGIGSVFFYKCRHGLLVPTEHFENTLDNFGVNLDHPSVSLMQLHVRTCITPGDDEALMIDLTAAERLHRAGGNNRKRVTRYNMYHMRHT